MHDAEINARLTALRNQGYPLTLVTEDAEAIVECINRIMGVISDDDRPLVRGDYDLATSAVHHPEPNEFGTSNQRLRSPYQMP